ncbi:MAG: RNase P subunit p30 family protein [Candidatus Bathyarchaeia archaeon]
MKKFADLHLCPSLRNMNSLKGMINTAYGLGYHFLGVSLPAKVSEGEIRELREICSTTGADLVTRVDLAPKTSRDLLNQLRHLRRRFEVVAVTCLSKAVARQAAKDRRVDLLSFPADPHKSFFDTAEGELASKALAALEINMASILSLQGFPRVRLLSRLRWEVETAKKFKVPLVISSGADNEYLLRAPHDFATLANLFDLPLSSALNSLSNVPRSIVERNRLKLSPGYVAPGVRIIKEGKDCPRA